MLALVVVGCGEDGGSDAESDFAKTDNAKPEQTDSAADEDSALSEAEAYAGEQFPEAKPTDDFLAAAVSGCYWGLTGEYIGAPANWSPEKAARIEYPEPDLQGVLNTAREDCK